MSFDKGHALLIGVGTYANAPRLNVPITADDATGLWNVLTRSDACGYSDDNVTVLTNDQATRQGILDSLDALVKNTGTDAMVLIFFSGHGVMLPGDIFALTTHDLRYAEDNSILSETVVTAKELLSKLRNLKAGKVLMLLNACHSGGAVSATLDANSLPPATLGASVPDKVTSAILATGTGRVVITACQAKEVAYVGDGELTLFPKALVAALGGDGITNQRGYIGAYELYDRVYELVTNEQPSQQPELTVSKGIGPFPVALLQGHPSPTLGVAPEANGPVHTEAFRSISSVESMRMLQEVLKSLPPTRSHHQQIGENAQVGTAIAGDVSGNVTSIQGGVTGPVMSGSFEGPVHVGERHTSGVDFGSGNQLGNVSIGDVAGRDIHKTTLHTGDDINVGNISGSSGIAIGRGARSTVRNVDTGGGDYAEGNIDKRKLEIDQRSGIHGGTFSGSGPIVGNVEGGTVNQGDQITFSGAITGSNINLKSTLSNVSQTITNASHGSPNQKAELQQLIVQLNDALQKLPAAQASDAEIVVDEVHDLVSKATQQQPNPRQVEHRANTLKQAAEDIKGALPTIFPIALAIVEKVRQFMP